jgi:pilus assembly protein CpaF
VTIRIHRLVARTFDDLIQLGTLTPAAAAWLEMCIKARLAIVIGGGTSSGKTNLLNAIARVADPRERIVVIEDTRELDLVVPDRVYLVTVNSRDPDRIVTQRHLVANALRMRPDRIVMGEVRDAAAWDAIKAATTGHEGTLLTLHAEDASGVIQRLIRLSREAPETANMPDTAMREAVAAAFQLIVFLQRMRLPNGSFARFVTEIVELNGLVGDGVVQQRKLFAWQAGRLEWTRQWPHERTKRRLFEAGFSDRDIESAFMRT